MDALVEASMSLAYGEEASKTILMQETGREDGLHALAWLGGRSEVKLFRPQRLNIEYLQFALLGDTVTVRTWAITPQPDEYLAIGFEMRRKGQADVLSKLRYALMQEEA